MHPAVCRYVRRHPSWIVVARSVAQHPSSRIQHADLHRILVTAAVRAQRSTELIPTVPVLVAMSFANLEKRVRAVTRDGSPLILVTKTISVTGPTDEVMRLVRGETRAYGVIQLKEDDLQQTGVLKLAVPEYHLPKGQELAEEQSII